MSARSPIAAPLGVDVLSASRTVVQHVDYVTDGSGEVIPAARFFLEVLSNPVNAVLLAVGGVVASVAVIGYLLMRPARRDIATFRRTLQEYADLVPLILRLSVGVSLIGAGFVGYFFTPVVPAPTRLLEVGVGFFILFGLATRCVALVGLLAYLGGLAVEPALLLANEYVPGFLAIILLGSGRPSVDHLIQHASSVKGTVCCRINPVHGVANRLDQRLAPYNEYAPTIVRLGLGFDFAYLGLTQKILDPGRAIQVVGKYNLTEVIPIGPGMWVLSVGLAEMTVGAALLVGLLTRGISILAFLIFTTTLFGLPDDPVLAHVLLFGLTSVLIITGSGPLSIDRYLTVETSPGQVTPAGHESETYSE